MRKYPILLALLIPVLILTTNCSKDTDLSDYEKQEEEYIKQVNEQFGKDTVIIAQYLVDHQLIAKKHEFGIYYIIVEPGNDYHPYDESKIEVNYKGYTTDGTVFYQTEEGDSFSVYLNTLITGWRIGIPLIGEGGKITLLLPSYYGFGSKSSEKVPANSVVIFEVTLIKFI